ncbi:TIR domain-containing protein [Lacibacter luteus]|uniref:TIR domain-containing protein n=1 Tax=Lacibacter luteus TaxID=2508719 RepID=A0A4Q1CIT1_9BACT|nr:toll/interleukin-1 receptor domain-containing protein [Lacibacter luteus]RXK60035.1 TIR domain-containing protein [Lacibacter luteus]
MQTYGTWLSLLALGSAKENLKLRMPVHYKYEVAISFAEEDRNIALALKLALGIAGFTSVYYYPTYQGKNWGTELAEQLTRTFYEEARYAIVLLSAHYFAVEKKYTKVEFKAIKRRIRSDPKNVYLLPIKLSADFSLKNYPGLSNLNYELWNYDPEKVAQYLKEQFGDGLIELRKTTDNITKINNIGNDALIIIGSTIRNLHNNQFKKDGT